MCVLSFPSLRGVSAMQEGSQKDQNFLSTYDVRVLSRGHALFPVCRTEAGAQCRALLFCQRPVCLASGALCAHRLGSIDTGSVLENRTSSTCPGAAVRCRFAGELTGSTPSPQFLWIHFPLPAPQRIAGNREASKR